MDEKRRGRRDFLQNIAIVALSLLAGVLIPAAPPAHR